MTTDYRAELQRLVKAYDDHGGLWPEDDVKALHQAVERARAYLAQSEPEELAGTMSASERWAVLSWVEDHIDTNKALRSWRDPTRGGLLMAEVHTVQPGVRARLAGGGRSD